MLESARKPIAIAAAAFALNGVACASSEPPQIPSTNRVVSPTILITGEWDSLNPQQRINILNEGSYPENIDFDQELIRASVEFYCQETNCKKTAAQLISSFYFVNAEEFINIYEEDNGIALSTEEKEAKSKGQLETVTSDGRIIVNNTALEHQIGLARENDDFIRGLEGRDVEAVFKTSVYAHSLGHANASEERVSIGPILINTGYQEITFTEIEGLDLIGTTSTGEYVRFASFEEALVEALTITMTNGKIPYRTFGKNYKSGAEFVLELNRLTGVTNEELERYGNGSLSITELARKWGSLDRSDEPTPPEMSAYLAIISIALHIQDLSDIPTTISNLGKFLRVS